jgi:hypothetical protein
MSLILSGTDGLTFNNATTQNSGGKVIQVVNATLTTETSSVTATFADTGLTASITPLFATSKILVLVDHTGCYSSNGTNLLAISLLRNATSIVTKFEGYGGYTGVNQSAFGGSSTNFLDSPATTSATTYKTQLANLNATGTVSVGRGPSIATITLMEVAA